MKRIKKLASLLLAAIMVLAMSVPAMAAEQKLPSSDPNNVFTITVKNTSDTLSMEGNVYSAYKLFDVTYSSDNSYAYQMTDAFKDFTYTVGDETYQGESLIEYLATLENNASALNAFSKAAGEYITSQSISAAGTATGTAANTVTIGVADAGYYLVTASATAEGNETVEALCALTTTDPAAQVNLKADAPTIDKKIDAATDTDPDNGNDLVVANNASVGDAVPFVITSQVPVMTGYEKYFFVVTDTLSEGLTFNDDVVITIGGNLIENVADVATNYEIIMYKTVGTDGSLSEVTTNANEARAFEIVFKDFIQFKDNPDTPLVTEGREGQEIKITYTATLNEKAQLGTVGNKNSVKLTYSTNPNTTGNGDPENPDKPGPNDPKGETPDKDTYTYATGIKLTKYDDSDPRQTLTGAKFTITGDRNNFYIVNETIFKEDAAGTYYLLKSGEYSETAPTADTLHLYDAESVNAAKTYSKIETVTKETKDTTPISAEGYVNENGILTFKGLSEGTYTIKEVVAPDGFNILKDDIIITITCTEPTDLTGSTECTWAVTKKVGENGTEETLIADNDNLFAFDVENKRGSLLPSTGGIGTTIFYVVGGILVVAAGILLVTKKRMSAR